MATSTKRKPTFAEAKQASLASVAGLTVAADTTPKFTSVTSEKHPPFEAGDTLSTKRHHVQYYSAAFEAATGNKITLSDDDIWSAIQKVSTEGMTDPTDIDTARLQFLDSMTSSNDAPASITDFSQDRLAATAYSLGGKADDQLEATLNVAIDGKLAWMGSPLIVASHLERIYGKDTLSNFPIVGTRKTNKQNKAGELHKDEVPEGYNGVTDYFWGLVKGEKKIVRYLQLFCDGMPEVHTLKTQRETVRDIMKGTLLQTIPEQFIKFVGKAQGGQRAQTDTPGLKGVEDDLTMRITSHVNRVSQAVAMWQVQQAIVTKLNKWITWQYVDGTPEATAKRVKPIQMYGRAIVEVDGEKFVEKSPQARPIAISQFIRYGKFIDECAAKDGKIETLVALEKASRARDKTEKVTPLNTAETVPQITNATQYVSYLRAVFNYGEEHQNMIKLALANPNTSGETAMWLVYAYDSMAGYFKDETIRALATNHDKLTRDATAKLTLAAPKK